MKRLFTLLMALVLVFGVCTVAGAVAINSDGASETISITAGLSKTDVTSITIEASAAPTVAYTWSEGAWSASITNPTTTFTISTASSLTKKVTAAWTTNNTVLADYGLTVADPDAGAFASAGVSLAPNAESNTSTKVLLETSGTPDMDTISGSLSNNVKIGDVVFTVSNP